MRKTSAPVIALLGFLIILPGCAAFNQDATRSELQVLKTQLARQQSQMAEQQVLLQALMGGEQERGSEHTRYLTEIRGQLEQLLQESRENRQAERERLGADNKTCPVVNPENNGRPCTDLTIIGALEVIHLQPPGRRLVARVDTGANTSSLDARDIEMFESDGEDYVRFKLPRRILGEDQKREFERPVKRFVRIIQAGKEDERRAVIELKFRLGNVERMAEFTLSDRGHLTYRALLGRNILRDFFAVDVANKFMISSEEESQERKPDSEERGDDDSGREDADDKESDDEASDDEEPDDEESDDKESDDKESDDEGSGDDETDDDKGSES